MRKHFYYRIPINLHINFILPSFLLSVYGGFTVVSLHELVNKFKYHIVCSPDSQLLRIFDSVVNKFIYYIVSNLILPLRIALLTLCC